MSKQDKPALPEPTDYIWTSSTEKFPYWDERALYAAIAADRAARVPVLTDEQIAAIERECYVNGALPFETRNRFARAVLAAATQGSKP